MSVAVAIVVVVLLAIAAGGGWYFFKKWRLKRTQKQLLSWARDTMNYSLVDEGAETSSVASSSSGMMRGRSATGVSVSEIPFTLYTNKHHGFRVQYPKEWSCHPSSANESVIVQFMCPQSERTYKRFSVTWDDISWSNITPSSYAARMIKNLPVAVPGAKLVSHRPLPSTSSYEVVYSVRDPVDSMQLTKLNVIVLDNNRAFTLVFAVDDVAFAQTEALARHLFQSFTVTSRDSADADAAAGVGMRSAFDGGAPAARGSRAPAHADPFAVGSGAAAGGGGGGGDGGGVGVGSGRGTGGAGGSRSRRAGGASGDAAAGSGGDVRSVMPVLGAGGGPGRAPASAAGDGTVPETPQRARDIAWRTERHELGLAFSVPQSWTMVPHKASAGSPGGTMEFVCDRREQYYKGLTVFAANLSSVRAPREKLLNDLLAHYKREVSRQSKGAVLEERSITSALSGSCHLLRVAGRRTLFDTNAAALVGLYTPLGGGEGTVYGFIVTFTTSADVFKEYEPVARYVFKSLAASPLA